MGVVTSRSALSRQHQVSAETGFHRCWYPIALARDLSAEVVLGRDVLGTRVVAYRDRQGRAVVQSAWCPHLGADLSLGCVADGHLRCPYHHWSFDTAGTCVRIPSGDKIPSAARIFTYPAAEAWGLVWAFNGDQADCDLPRIPGAEEATTCFEAGERGRRDWETWIAVSNGVDFQHLRTLHGLPAGVVPERIEVEATGIEFRTGNDYYLQHGRISGTNTFAQHLRVGGNDMFMMFSGVPIGPGASMGYFVAGVPKEQADRLSGVRKMMDQLSEEDAPVLAGMRFRRGILTASDRHLAAYFKYVDGFPGFLPPQA